ncbi:hypothetical protein H9Q72_000534 [Fusarium xylarioides]|uniref:Aminoglycoside phosphotransferase domain-containing protein n=1 Tax=Fusarium xylarioides TaxID=221167 RepID=A0A9P7I2Z9_9HYPO|nr:hypothetical protein H9Q72_000534 [Fusarium xylarioides]
MNPERRLERENGDLISFSEAQNRDGDIVAQLGYVAARDELYRNLDRQQQTICSLVRHHLDLGVDERCTVLPQDQWIKGGFNVCIPIQTESGPVRRKLMLRCCLPYKLAEAQYPESFASDMLSYHDGRLLSHPNIIYDAQDCRGSMAVRTLLRALSCKYLNKEFRNGPFLLQFTDLHPSNIFVDEDWNVTCFLDLEWISALPVEMVAVPYWVTGRKIDEIKEEHLDEFDHVRQEFMRILEEEERTAANLSIPLSRVMENMWKSKGVWFWSCLESVDAMSYLVPDHICPQFGTLWSSKTETILADFWCNDSRKMVDKKLNELADYQKTLQGVFRPSVMSFNI